MQTAQVNNLTNMLSAPAPKAGGANAPAEPFGKVLSREVAERSEPPKAPQASDAPQKQDSAKVQGQSAKSDSGAKKTESRDSDDGESKADAADTDTRTGKADDILALVAGINQLAAHGGNAAASDAEAGTGRTAATATEETVVDGAASGKKAQDAADLIGHGKTAADAIPEDRDAFAAALQSRTGGAKGEQDLSAKIEQAVMPAAPPTGSQVAMQAAQPLAHQAAEHLAQPVGTAAWNQSLGQKVVWMVAGEQHSASLSLNPPDLGPLQVVLSVNNSHASATFTAAQPEVRQALEAAMPKLREMLGEAGIQLGQATVNSGSGNQQGAPDQQASRAGRGFGAEAGTADTAPRVSHVKAAVAGNGLVDTFA